MKKTSEIFDVENIARKQIEFSGRALPQVKVGQIWWYYVGINIGQEISRKRPYHRPCIILRTYPGSSLVHIVPLSGKVPKLCHNRYIPLYKYKDFGLKKSFCMLHQCKTIDKKRLLKVHSDKLISRGLLKYIMLHKA